MYKLITLFCLSVFLFTIPAIQGGSVPLSAPGNTPDINSIIAEYRQQIPIRMEQENIPGLAIAVVDDQGVLWSEGFGYTDWNRKTKVTDHTLFSIQSMSKSFTATAAMFATQDGLVDLDTPISAYLPEFHVHSIFEEQPEQNITLRMLLSHTAGFTHEAAVGGNFDKSRPTFEQHIASISDTWLKFPVGQGYSYSNLGVDLAGYILQVRSGKPFHQYVKEKVFDPLGMTSSTLDFEVVHADPGRAVGHNPLYLGPLSPRQDWAIIPSGGVWATASDMSRYLRFHINSGALDGARLLREELAETMYTPPYEAARQEGYALGISVSHRNGTRELQHGGGGFGFNSNMLWYPDLKLGVVVLTNAEHAELITQLPGEILEKVIYADLGMYQERERTAPAVKPALAPIASLEPLTEPALAKLITGYALPDDPAAAQRLKGYAGTYIFCRWGIPVSAAELKDEGGQLSISIGAEHGKLVEVQPGLFFAPNGGAVDLRSADALVENMHLVKVNPAAHFARIVFYSFSALASLSFFVFWPVRALVLRDRRKKGLPTPRPDRLAAWSGLLAGLASLFSLICLVFIARVPYLIDVPWPVPYHELPWWQFAGMSLPYIALCLAAGAAVVSLLAWKNPAGAPANRITLAALAICLVVFNLALLI